MLLEIVVITVALVAEGTLDRVVPAVIQMVDLFQATPELAAHPK